MVAKKIRRLLGEAFVEEGLITKEQLQKALEENKRTGEPLRHVLIRTNLVSEEDIVSFFAEETGAPYVKLSDYLIEPAVTALVPEQLARKYELVPIFKIGDALTVAMVNPMDVMALDAVRLKCGFVVEPAVSTEAEIKHAIDQYYGVKGTMEEVIKTIGEKKTVPGELKEKELEALAEEAPIVKLVNLVIMEALKERASDIHIEPEEYFLRVRYRVDGILHEASSPPKHLESALISRIKILANMNIAERRVPQDGRIQMRMENRLIDIRVSTVPTVFGENVVMRLLDTSSILLTLNQLGFQKEVFVKYETLIKKPYGIILVTGPTGSGKTTTLYGSLNTINSVEKNIITIEDPVEYQLNMIRQIQVNPKAGITFANGLRSILRQDPDIIMVGEIRDVETAEVAVQAALTGHLVLSTLHTNDAPTAITRLIDMGVEPFLVASSITAVLAQRLVRILCKECKGKGCKVCLNTGYKGRIGIFELMVPNEEIKSLTIAKASTAAIRKAAILSGMETMREDGMRKVASGITAEQEVVRVTQEENA